MSNEISPRDYFAGQALSGLIAKLPVNMECADIVSIITPLAEDCYIIADAMIKERNKK